MLLRLPLLLFKTKFFSGPNAYNRMWCHLHQCLLCSIAKSLIWGIQNTERHMSTSFLRLISEYLALICVCGDIMFSCVVFSGKPTDTEMGVWFWSPCSADIRRRTNTERLAWREVMTVDSLSRTAGVALQQSHDGWVALCALYKLFKGQLTWETTQGQRSKISHLKALAYVKQFILGKCKTHIYQCLKFRRPLKLKCQYNYLCRSTL